MFTVVTYIAKEPNSLLTCTKLDNPTGVAPWWIRCLLFFFLILPMLLTQVTLAASCLILSANLNRELPWSGLAHICATDTYWSILMQVSDK